MQAAKLTDTLNIRDKLLCSVGQALFPPGQEEQHDNNSDDNGVAACVETTVPVC